MKSYCGGVLYIDVYLWLIMIVPIFSRLIIHDTIRPFVTGAHINNTCSTSRYAYVLLVLNTTLR